MGTFGVHKTSVNKSQSRVVFHKINMPVQQERQQEGKPQNRGHRPRKSNNKHNEAIKSKQPASAFTDRSYSLVDSIRSLTSIPGRSDIEIAKILGFQVAVKKGVFRTGDRCAYVPIDTLVDMSVSHFNHNDVIRFASAGTPGGAVRWVRVNSVKLTPTFYSEGIALPLHALADHVLRTVNANHQVASPKAGLDVALGVQKYRKDDMERPQKEEGVRSPISVAAASALTQLKTARQPLQIPPSAAVALPQSTIAATQKSQASAALRPHTSSSPQQRTNGMQVSTQQARSQILKPIKGAPEYKEGPFPSEVIPATDETALRRCPECLEELQGREIYVTKKMDGSSMTVIVDHNGRFTVCSRHKVCDVGSTFHQFVMQTGLETKLRGLGYPIAVQFEYCGVNVNNNRMGLTGYDMWVFTAKKLTTPTTTFNALSGTVRGSGTSKSKKNRLNRRGTKSGTVESSGSLDSTEDSTDCTGDELCGEYCGLDELSDICSQMGVKMVPLLERFVFDAAEWTSEKFQQYANQQTYTLPTSGNQFQSPTATSTQAEGIVIRPVTPFFSPKLKKMFSFKVIAQGYAD